MSDQNQQTKSVVTFEIDSVKRPQGGVAVKTGIKGGRKAGEKPLEY